MGLDAQSGHIMVFSLKIALQVATHSVFVYCVRRWPCQPLKASEQPLTKSDSVVT